MTNLRSEDEKLALSLNRYKAWVDSLAMRQAEVTELGARLDSAVEKLLYEYLEAREEQERLIDMGMSQKQIESVGTIPTMSLDPLALLRRARLVSD